MFIDGSVLENEQAGAGFVIPEFKTKKKKKKKKKKERKKKKLLLMKGNLYIYCRIGFALNGFIINS